MKSKKTKIKPGRGWACLSEMNDLLLGTCLSHKMYKDMVRVVVLPLSDYRALVKNQRKVK